MSVVQVAFDLPPEIQKGLAEGALEFGGLVIRNAKGVGKGQIVKHLDPIGRQAAQEAKQVAQKAVNIAKANPKAAVVAVGVGAVAALAAGGVAAGKAVKKNRVAKKVPWEVKNFWRTIKEYDEAANSGKMSEHVIDEVIKALDSIDQSEHSEWLWKQINSKDLYKLINSMRDYTLKLSKANNVDIAEELNDDKVIDIRSILNAQKKVFEEAA